MTATTESLRTMHPLLDALRGNTTTCNAGPTVDLYPGALCLEGVPAIFDDTSEWVPDTDAFDSPKREVFMCELVSINLGGLKLDRYQVIDMTSKAEVEAIEEARAVELGA